MNFVDVATLSTLAGVSRQAIEKVLKRGQFGQPPVWHGHTLEVRTFHGRGGRSGIQYQVKVSSLPAHLQERLKTLQMTDEAVSRLRFGDDAQFERAWKHEVISNALKHPKGSAERKAEIEKLHGEWKLNWTGSKRRLTKSTLYKWIEIYEFEGIHGLAQKVRRDKGEKKVFISRAWSDAVPFDDETKASIHNDIKQYVRSLLKGDGQFKQTLVLTAEKLKEISGAYGFRLNDHLKEEQVFRIPQAFVQEEAHFKAVARHKKDRKASEDNKPRIRRTTANLEPMEIVVMDVHHINVHVLREDGTYSTPKLIAFHDIATNRVFCELIQFEDRGGVRNSDIITAFVNMCQHPAFGVPQFLYADNGSEYRFADDLEDALKLGTKVFDLSDADARKHLIRAKPYNAAAKQVEGWFRQFNQQHARHIQGWRDDDPMNPKRPQLGKLHAPYPHGFDAFCDEFFSHLTAYENMPQKGQLKTSPAMAFREHVRKGWKANVLNPDLLLTVFTKPETRIVKRHGIDVRGQPWTCDGLLEFFGRTVLVHIPKYHGFAELLITDEHGVEIGTAVADRAFDVLDERGAKESARRVSKRNKALTKLGKSVPDIDVGAELIAYGQKQLPVVPNEPDATISVARPGSQRRAILPVPAENQSRMKEEEYLRTENDAARALMAKLTSSRKIS
ncbi:helix-turn-helix domain-containing protein [Allorhizobium undicola]|uniref:helix-turn-helix domain-containing protein n=1 Tax=Allorhizobium undicola TaxID=78527 RepID=UPI003D3469EC